MTTFGSLLGKRPGAYSGNNQLQGFWNTSPSAQISGMSQPWQNRINSMWGRFAPAGAALPGTFGEWQSAIQGYHRGGNADDPNRGFPGGGGAGGGAGGGSGPGGGTPNQMTWAFPQYSQTWAFTPPAAPPLTMPTPFNKSTYGGAKKKSGSRD